MKWASRPKGIALGSSAIKIGALGGTVLKRLGHEAPGEVGGEGGGGDVGGPLVEAGLQHHLAQGHRPEDKRGHQYCHTVHKINLISYKKNFKSLKVDSKY